jgi:hypothetical protein
VYHWAETGGSDAHTPTAVGCARTVFAGKSAAEVRAAIERRETAPMGAFWQPREYVAFVSHRMRHGGGATHDLLPVKPARVSFGMWTQRRLASRERSA